MPNQLQISYFAILIVQVCTVALPPHFSLETGDSAWAMSALAIGGVARAGIAWQLAQTDRHWRWTLWLESAVTALIMLTAVRPHSPWPPGLRLHETAAGRVMLGRIGLRIVAMGLLARTLQHCQVRAARAWRLFLRILQISALLTAGYWASRYAVDPGLDWSALLARESLRIVQAPVLFGLGAGFWLLWDQAADRQQQIRVPETGALLRPLADRLTKVALGMTCLTLLLSQQDLVLTIRWHLSGVRSWPWATAAGAFLALVLIRPTWRARRLGAGFRRPFAGVPAGILGGAVVSFALHGSLFMLGRPQPAFALMGLVLLGIALLWLAILLAYAARIWRIDTAWRAFMRAALLVLGLGAIVAINPALPTPWTTFLSQTWLMGLIAAGMLIARGLSALRRPSRTAVHAVFD